MMRVEQVRHSDLLLPFFPHSHPKSTIRHPALSNKEVLPSAHPASSSSSWCVAPKPRATPWASFPLPTSHSGNTVKIPSIRGMVLCSYFKVGAPSHTWGIFSVAHQSQWKWGKIPPSRGMVLCSHFKVTLHLSQALWRHGETITCSQSVARKSELFIVLPRMRKSRFTTQQI